MKISKSGNSYKIKCNDKEYLMLKYAIFSLDEWKDDFMRDFIMRNNFEEEDLDDIAHIMKGTE